MAIVGEVAQDRWSWAANAVMDDVRVKVETTTTRSSR